MKHLNLPLVRYVFGLLLLMEALFMAVATGVSGYYCHTAGDKDWPALLISTLITASAGAGMLYSGRRYHEGISQREGFLIVAVSWVLFSVFGMLPYLFYGTFDSLADAFFETMSGFTTTGATVMTDIDMQPHGILFWRSLTHWLGGLGIVVFTLALLPIIGSGATMMYNAEVSGISMDKLRPKIHQTARRIWIIYIVLTCLCAIFYAMGPMSLFDAINHAFSTMSTGGFSTHQSSFGYFQSAYLEYVCAIFMFLGSVNFSLYYLVGQGQWRLFLRNEEFLWFSRIVLCSAVLFLILMIVVRYGQTVTAEQALAFGDDSMESMIRSSLFHTMTIISTTGFQASCYDYVLWGPLFWIPTIMLMVCGGCAGSTAGGFKVVRVLILLKNVRNEFMHHIHPRAVTTVRLNGHALVSEMVYRILAMLLIYLLLIVVSIFVLLCMGLSFDTAIGTVFSAFGNVGPALGSTGPAFTWAEIPTMAKWYLSFAMLTGRLEIFTVILLFTKMFWQKH